MEDNTNFDFNSFLEQYRQQREEALKSPLEERQEKVERLITILGQIDTQLSILETTLHKLWEHSRRTNNEANMRRSTEKLQTLERLRYKVNKARLELNISFL